MVRSAPIHWSIHFHPLINNIHNIPHSTINHSHWMWICLFSSFWSHRSHCRHLVKFLFSNPTPIDFAILKYLHSIVHTGSTLGAISAFLLSRYLFRSCIMKLAANSKKFKVIETMIQRYGLSMLIICRLSPIMPFVIENYIFGITSIGIKHYLIGTLASLPGCIVYVILGSGIRTLQDIESVERKAIQQPIAFCCIIIAGVLTFLAIILFSILARRHYRRIERELIHQNEYEIEMQDILPETSDSEPSLGLSDNSIR